MNTHTSLKRSSFLSTCAVRVGASAVGLQAAGAQEIS
jgi:hypothetical protein